MGSMNEKRLIEEKNSGLEPKVNTGFVNFILADRISVLSRSIPKEMFVL